MQIFGRWRFPVAAAAAIIIPIRACGPTRAVQTTVLPQRPLLRVPRDPAVNRPAAVALAAATPRHALKAVLVHRPRAWSGASIRATRTLGDCGRGRCATQPCPFAAATCTTVGRRCPRSCSHARPWHPKGGCRIDAFGGVPLTTVGSGCSPEQWPRAPCADGPSAESSCAAGCGATSPRARGRAWPLAIKAFAATGEIGREVADAAGPVAWLRLPVRTRDAAPPARPRGAPIAATAWPAAPTRVASGPSAVATAVIAATRCRCAIDSVEKFPQPLPQQRVRTAAAVAAASTATPLRHRRGGGDAAAPAVVRGQPPARGVERHKRPIGLSQSARPPMPGLLATRRGDAGAACGGCRGRAAVAKRATAGGRKSVQQAPRKGGGAARRCGQRRTKRCAAAREGAAATARACAATGEGPRQLAADGRRARSTHPALS